MTSKPIVIGHQPLTLPLWFGAALAWLAALPATTAWAWSAYTHRPKHLAPAAREHVPARHYRPLHGWELAASRMVCAALLAAAVLIVWDGLDVGAALAMVAAAAGSPGARILHAEQHPLAGRWVTLNLAHLGLEPSPTEWFRVEDWWDRVTGQPWGEMDGNAAAVRHALRAGFGGLPPDNEVVYGKDERGLGHIIHVSELGDVAPEVQA